MSDATVNATVSTPVPETTAGEPQASTPAPAAPAAVLRITSAHLAAARQLPFWPALTGEQRRLVLDATVHAEAVCQMAPAEYLALPEGTKADEYLASVAEELADYAKGGDLRPTEKAWEDGGTAAVGHDAGDKPTAEGQAASDAKCTPAGQEAAKTPLPDPAAQLAERKAAEEQRTKVLQGLLGNVNAACWAYARGTQALLLDVGCTMNAYLVARLDGISDPNSRKATRAAGVKRCQAELDDACSQAATPDVDDCLRYWACVAVYAAGDKAAAGKLGVGQLRQFATTLFRAKDTEAWGFKPDTTPEQQTALRALWVSLASGAESLSADDTTVRIRQALAKAVAQQHTDGTVTKVDTRKDGATVETVKGTNGVVTKTVTKPDGSKSTTTTQTKPAGKGAVVRASSAAPKPAPVATPESPAECAAAIARMLYGNPNADKVLQLLGQQHTWTEQQCAALCEGLKHAGRRQALVAMAQSAIKAANAIKPTEAAKKAG